MAAEFVEVFKYKITPGAFDNGFDDGFDSKLSQVYKTNSTFVTTNKKD